MFQRLSKKKVKKKFSKKNKFIVKTKRSFGLFGLALITPAILGIPLGSVVASIYYTGNKKAIPVFLSSILLWSLILSYFSLYLKGN